MTPPDQDRPGVAAARRYRARWQRMRYPLFPAGAMALRRRRRDRPLSHQDAKDARRLMLLPFSSQRRRPVECCRWRRVDWDRRLRQQAWHLRRTLAHQMAPRQAREASNG